MAAHLSSVREASEKWEKIHIWTAFLSNERTWDWEKLIDILLWVSSQNVTQPCYEHVTQNGGYHSRKVAQSTAELNLI